MNKTIKAKIFIYLFLCLPATLLSSTNVFESIVCLPKDMHGYFGPRNRYHLEVFIRNKQPKKIVEIGAWLGLSAIFMAKLAPADVKVFCVDPWIPYSEMEAMPDAKERLKRAYEQFLSNCIHEKVTDKIVPMRMTSMEAVQAIQDSNFDLIYIDGLHTEEAVYDDIMGWYPKLAKNGIICGDDIMWPSVEAAVTRAAHILNRRVNKDDNFWWFE
jgi:predicted O-methyltransferase YrrM